MTNNESKPVLKSSFSLFAPSIDAIKLNLQSFLLLVFFPVFLFVVLDFMGSFTGNSTQEIEFSPSMIAFAIFSIFVSLILAPAVIHLELQSVRNIKVSVGESLQVGVKYLLRFIGLILLISLFVLGGLILFIIPGLIMFRRYFLAPYYLIDKDLSIRDAMQQSAASSKLYSGYIWGVIGVSVLLSVPGFVPVFGSAISAVFTTLYSVAPALRYNEIHNLPTVPSK